MKNHVRYLSVVWALLLVLASLMGCHGGAGDYSDLPGATGNASNSVSPGDSVSPTGAATVNTDINNYEKLKISLMTNEGEASIYAPKETALYNYIRLKMAEYVGRDVEVNYVTSRKDGSDLVAGQVQKLADLILTNTLPDVVIMDMTQPYYDPKIIDGNNFYEITPELILANMPLFTQRLKQYGLDMATQFLPAQGKDETTGKLWHIPAFVPLDAMRGLPTSFLNKVPKTPVFQHETVVDDVEGVMMDWKDSRIPNASNYNFLAIRDDVLKAIHSNARSEQELTNLYMEKSGSLAVNDVAGDIPIRTLDDLKKLLIGIKDLDMKDTHGQSIIPMRFNYMANTRFLSSAMGLLSGKSDQESDDPVLQFQDSFILGNGVEKGAFFYATEQNKTLLRWLNEIYREGLLGIDPFKKGEGIESYAVVLPFTLPSSSLGYRLIPMGAGTVDFSRNSNKYVGVNASAPMGVFLSKKIMESDVPDVMKWLDYQMSEESDELCYWGMPEWYTGEGADRKYKAEYAELEAWALKGTQGGKDGYYYGVSATPALWYAYQGSHPETYKPYNIKAVSFFGYHFCYPNAPYYIQMNKDILINSLAMENDIESVSMDVMWYQDVLPKQTLYVESDDFRMGDLYSLPQVKSFVDAMTATDVSKLYRDLIVCDPLKFDANWDKLQQKYQKMGMDLAAEAANQYVAEHWQTGVLNQIKK